MRCIYCGKDSNYQDRQPLRTCRQCGHKFAFEPQSGDPVTDRLFFNAVNSVSSDGEVNWTLDHLYYDVCKRKSRRNVWKCWWALIPVVIILLVLSRYFPVAFIAAMFVGMILGLNFIKYWVNKARIPIRKEVFNRLWKQWIEVHDVPSSPIQSGNQITKVDMPLEADLFDYSFDRAMFCEHNIMVDFLLANNFHFENSCPILSISGYPEYAFEQVLNMLQRNPDVVVFVIHDASIEGCYLPYWLQNESGWFEEGVKIVDLGLRPKQARELRGCNAEVTTKVSEVPIAEITEDEMMWLSKYSVEWSAVRPELMLKRLFNGINSKEAPGDSKGGPVLIPDSFG